MRNGTGRPAERGSDCRPSPGRPWPPRSSRGWRGTPSGPGGWTSAPSSPGPDRGRGCGAGSLHRAGASGARLSAWGCGCPGGGRSSPFPALGGALASVGGLKPTHRNARRMGRWGRRFARARVSRGGRRSGSGRRKTRRGAGRGSGRHPALKRPSGATWGFTLSLHAFHTWRCRIRKAALRPCGGRGRVVHPSRSDRGRPGAPAGGAGSNGGEGQRRGGVNGEGRMDGRLGLWGRGRRAGRRARNEAEASARLGP